MSASTEPVFNQQISAQIAEKRMEIASLLAAFNQGEIPEGLALKWEIVLGFNETTVHDTLAGVLGAGEVTKLKDGMKYIEDAGLSSERVLLAVLWYLFPDWVQ